MYGKSVGPFPQNSERNFPFDSHLSTLASQNTIQRVHATVRGIERKL